VDFEITNAELIDDEDDYLNANIFFNDDYSYNMYFINDQNEIIDDAYGNFRVYHDRFDPSEERLDNSDPTYIVCINIFPCKRKKN
jgi:hypothetical protein